MTKTKAIALFVIVVGSLLYLKSVLYSPVPPWEGHHQEGMTAYRDKNYPEAEKQFKAALTEAEKLPTDDWRLTQTLSNLAEIYRIQSKYSQATPYFKRLVQINEESFGPDHPNIAAYLNNLAQNYRAQGMLAEAAPLYKRSLDIWEKSLGPDNSLVLFALKNYVSLLREMGSNAEAESYQSRLQSIQPEKTDNLPAN
jgi:tetratricopeptide (TPR) repeat protein